MTEPPSQPAKPRRKRRRGCLLALISIFLAGLVAAELVARYGYGLGDPPLYEVDPQIEYLHKPSSSYQRFGNRVAFNSWSMRSDEFAQRKDDPDEFRVMVIGDSVINGGAWTDQSDTVTEVLRRNLVKRLNRPVVVGNISAGSWGPPNQLAYVEKFGFFDADAVIIVLGSEDFGDAPTFDELGSEKPTRKPVFALQEVVTRYVPLFFNWMMGSAGPPPSHQPSTEEVDTASHALRQMIDLAQQQRIPLAVGLYRERSEITGGGVKPGYEAFKLLLENRQVPVIEFAPAVVKAIDRNTEPYRDWVHPNELGQKLMAEDIERWLMGNVVR